MSVWCHRFRSFTVFVGGCVALVLSSSCLASDAVPSGTSSLLLAEDPDAAGYGRATVGVVEGAAVGAGIAHAPASGVGVRLPAVFEAEATARPERDCSPRLLDSFRVSDTRLEAMSIEVSRAAFGCAHELGLVYADDRAAISALGSRGIRGPLLLASPGFNAALMNEIERLEPELIVTAGIDERLLHYALPEFAVEQLPVADGTAPFPSGFDFLDEGASYYRVWMVDDSGQAGPLAAVARQVGVGVVAATGDLRALPPSARDAISRAAVVEVLADLGEDAVWQLDVVRRGEELPGGGFLLFGADAANPVRRLLAAYGHPSTSALGVLGEQGPQETVERLRAIAEGYEADGLAVLPAFEIIATIASAGAGADGDYSNETSRDAIRPWVEAAAASGTYVVLDLQPGRSDFLSQAKIYEEFLALPHVGLALDPEWRLKPHQVHLAQIGTVDSAEINRVSEWLAGLVRHHSLPQKLLVIHQFRHSMITDREHINTPPELAVVIHMDGQGSQSAKFSTWNALTGQDDADRYFWGWKNFYDEDTPVATPTQVLGQFPTPVFVTFQ